jgi:hypothetical protein
LIVFAALPAHSQNQKAGGITVTPVSDQFEITPGASVSRTIRVINPIASEITLYPRVLDFHTDNDQGLPQFYTVKDRSSPYAMSTWITFSKPFLRILPNEEERFEAIITAPQNADPGGHYAAVLFSTEPPKLDEDISQIGVVGLVGTLLLARIPGNVTEKLLLDDFTAPRFLISPPANFTARFSNVGNVHVQPQGEIKIRNWAGDVRTTLTVNEGWGNVLPSSKRRFENSWQFDWKALGKYTATLSAYYGNPEQQLSATRTFYIIPLWLIIAVIALLLLIIAWTIHRRRRGKPVVLTNTLPTQPSTRSSKLVMR